MYLAYWDLKHLPFENVPDPNYFFDSEIHHPAFEDLRNGILQRKGALLLTGDIGCGKTTLTQRVLLSLPEKRFDVALITYPSLSPLEMLREIIQQLGLETNNTANASKSNLLHDLQKHLSENAASNRDTLICIDEAQSIPTLETFEELRLLLNFQLSDRFLVSLLFVGQPELKNIVSKLPQLRQRLALALHLGPLCMEDTSRYVLYRLRAAGCNRPILTRQGVEAIYKHTGGVPRAINHLADHCLRVGMRKGVSLINSELVAETVESYPS